MNKRMPKRLADAPMLFDRARNMFTKDGSILQNDIIKQKIVTPYFKPIHNEFAIQTQQMSRISNQDSHRPQFNLLINEAPSVHYNRTFKQMTTSNDLSEQEEET